METNKLKDQNAVVFFDRFSTEFDTLYDHQRGVVMRWLDSKFRNGIYERYVKTFEALGNLEGKTVLDIGCGSGPYIKEALERNAKLVTGLDPAAGMLKISAQRLNNATYNNRFSLVEGLFPNTEVYEHDFAIVMGVFDYVDDKEAFMSQLYRVVKEKAIASFPSKHWFRTPLRKFRYKLRNCPLWFYDENQIRDLAHKSGFSGAEISKIKGAGQDYVVVLIK